MELNSLTDEILIKIFVCLDFKTRHNRIPLVCLRWANLVRSNELWHEVLVVPHEESGFCGGTVSQSKVFRWCNQPHVRPFIGSLKLMGLGAEHDDFTAVGLGALFGICCSALTKLEVQATRLLLSDLTSLLCCFSLTDLALVCIDPDPLNPFHPSDIQCVSGLRQLQNLIFDLNLVVVPGDLSQLKNLRRLSVCGTGSTMLAMSFQLSALTHLEELVVKNPLWAEVPDAVYSLPNLKSFEIRGHPLLAHNLGFCPAAAQMHQLERLGIIAHQLQKAPNEIGDMIFLKQLDLSLNNFDECLPPDVMFPFKKLIRLESLDISHCGLKHLPISLRSLVNLEELNLSGNRFESMNNVLADCLHLKRLIMRGCGLEAVPLQISDIPYLEHLDISNNPVTSVEGLRELLSKERLVALVFCQEKWNAELVGSACRMARIWGKHEPIVE